MRVACGIAIATLAGGLTLALAGTGLLAQESPPSQSAPAQPSATAPGEGTRSTPPTAAEIEQWVRELAHPQFSVREQATESLGKAGVSAIGPLLSATREKQLEIGVRAVRALRQIYETAANDDFDTAESALEAIRVSKNLALARRADQALGMREADRQRRALARIEQLGGEIRLLNRQSSRNLNIVLDDDEAYVEQLLLGDDWKGGDEGLKYVRRVVRVGAIYVTPGSKISVAAIADLQADLPNVQIQQRGSAMLGISCEPLLDGGKGLLVSRVQEGSGAAQAGLEPNDIIVKFEGEEIKDFQVVIDVTKTRKVGDKLTLEVERNGTLSTIIVTLGKWSVKDAPARPLPRP